jgi:hypothetical protein
MRKSASFHRHDLAGEITNGPPSSLRTREIPIRSAPPLCGSREVVLLFTVPRESLSVMAARKT